MEDTFLGRVYELLENYYNDPDLTVSRLTDEWQNLNWKLHSLLHLNHHKLIQHYLTGFKTPSHFIAVFKEFYHKTPTEFAQNGYDKV